MSRTAPVIWEWLALFTSIAWVLAQSILLEKRIMSNRRRLARERLEIYLVHLILMYRRLELIVGLLLLVYAIATIFVNRLAGYVTMIPAIFLLLLGNSYNIVVYTARLGAWIATIGMSEDE